MNEDILKGKWKHLSGGIKQQWGKLTDDTVTQIDGSREKFVGKLQELYGYTRQQAEQAVDDYMAKLR
jgi:uncharacterized protein YjbJ (UPF0337 family)